MIRHIVAGGIYADCDPSNGSFVASLDNGKLHCNGALVDSAPDLMFVRTQFWEGKQWITGKGHNDGLCWIWNSLDKQWIPVAPTATNSPVVFGIGALAIVTHSNVWQAYYLNSRILGDTNFRQIGVNGFRYYDIFTHELITGDQTYGPQPYELSEYTDLHTVVVGQGRIVGGCIIIYNGVRYILESGNTTFIHCYLNNGKLMVSMTKTEGNKPSAIFYSLLLSEINLLPIEPVNPDVPVDPPVDPPIEIIMKLPNQVKVIRDQFIAKYPYPSLANPNPSDSEKTSFEVVFREYMGKLIQQIVFSFPNQGYGWKDAGGGRPPSKDGMANNLLSAGHLILWDMFGGVGTGHPTLVNDPDSQNIDGQHFIPVEGKNFLDDDTPVEPPVDSDLEDRVSKLEDIVAQQAKIIETCIKVGMKIGLKSNGNYYLTAEEGGIKQSNAAASVLTAGNVNATREGLGAWESFTIEKP